MSWMHGWAMALGAAAVAAPILIHLLTRPRPRRAPLSTIRFVHEAVRQRRARNRLRDAIVLTLRTLAILLLAAAMLRPWFGMDNLAVREGDAPRVRVVLLD